MDGWMVGWLGMGGRWLGDVGERAGIDIGSF